MTIALLAARWVSGKLQLYEKSSGTSLITFDPAGLLVTLENGVKLDGVALDLSQTELGLIDGVTAGAIVASKAVARDAGGRIPLNGAVIAAAGNATGNATAITTDVAIVTGADNAKGVILPTGVAAMVTRVLNTDATHTLKVYPDTGGQVNAGGADVAFSVAPGREATFFCTGALTWYASTAPSSSAVAGVAQGYKIARGVAAITGSGTVVTGLATVVAVTASMQDDADVNAYPGVTAQIGDQAGTPAAGSVFLKAWKPTTGGAGGNATPTAASLAKSINWIAVGT